MNQAFTSPDGFVAVTTPDQVVPRPRPPGAPFFFCGQLGAQPVDIAMAWLPTYPVPLHQRRRTHPNWLGVFDPAAEQPAVMPTSWTPEYPRYRDAPRLHRVFGPYSYDPLSGENMNAALGMAWDPRQHPIVTRARLKTGGYAELIPLAVIAAGNDCVELVDVEYTVPLLADQALVGPTFLAEVFTRPDLLTEDLC